VRYGEEEVVVEEVIDALVFEKLGFSCWTFRGVALVLLFFLYGICVFVL